MTNPLLLALLLDLAKDDEPVTVEQNDSILRALADDD